MKYDTTLYYLPALSMTAYAADLSRHDHGQHDNSLTGRKSHISGQNPQGLAGRKLRHGEYPCHYPEASTHIQPLTITSCFYTVIL